MKGPSLAEAAESRPEWETLEAFARQGIQRLLPHELEEEVEQLLGRRRYGRRDGIDAAPGYRNGYGKRPGRINAAPSALAPRDAGGRNASSPAGPA